MKSNESNIRHNSVLLVPLHRVKLHVKYKLFKLSKYLRHSSRLARKVEIYSSMKVYVCLAGFALGK